ncbi:GNAT family N-acetyltransferase [Actinocrispum wychmicini]|uniref:GNAT family N-acetyltransferase n=1 Tax=Actinocrispum wychmicini TaxID=1213861 RepID=UPI00104E353C|nr:hypothetical protein [Actinocrispum wychmicini]
MVDEAPPPSYSLSSVEFSCVLPMLHGLTTVDWPTERRDTSGHRWVAETSVYVADGHRGRGVGKALLAQGSHRRRPRRTPWRSVIYVRDLLIAAGVLPPIDRFLFLFEQWLPGWLAAIDDPDHRKILNRHAAWHVLRKLRRVAADGPIGGYRNNNARQQLKMAAVFLTDLADRGRDLAGCTQAELDRWFAGHPTATDQSLSGHSCAGASSSAGCPGSGCRPPRAPVGLPSTSSAWH